MYDSGAFKQLVATGHPTGEVVGVERFLVSVKGLEGVAAGGLVLFESGQRGMVREASNEQVLVLNLDTENTNLGELVVVQNNTLTTGVGTGLIGRVVTPLLKPLDGKGPVTIEANWPVFNQAPGMMERQTLKDQLATGVTIVDTLFPIVLGQRIAILGDSKVGKSSFLLQVGAHQAKTDRVMVYVLIGKRRVEIDHTVSTLIATGAMENSIVIVADIFSSLAQSYLAPYIGCAIAEYLWHTDRDVVIMYDDLSSHAKVYREVSLLARGNPGRESYPGDMFYAHSSLLERAGKLAKNGKTLTALPTILTPSDDITAYLPTSIMSITDGQLIFDMATFRKNIRPAVNTALSVSRVGGRAQSARQKDITGALFKQLAEYRQAEEFAHFGADMAPETRLALDFGRLIYDILHQPADELFSLAEQQLMFEVIFAEGSHGVDVAQLKKLVKATSHKLKDPVDYPSVAQQLLATLGQKVMPA